MSKKDNNNNNNNNNVFIKVKKWSCKAVCFLTYHKLS